MVRGIARVWKLVRILAWEAALLYGASLFMHAWNSSSAGSAVYLLVMNLVQLCVTMVVCISTLAR